MLSYLVFQVSFIGFPDVLGEVAVEGKCRGMGRQLGDILDLDKLSLYRRGMVLFNGFLHHLVQLWSRDPDLAVFKNLDGQLQCFVDPLFGQGGNKKHGDIHKGFQPFS